MRLQHIDFVWGFLFLLEYDKICPLNDSLACMCTGRETSGKCSRAWEASYSRAVAISADCRAICECLHEIPAAGREVSPTLEISFSYLVAFTVSVMLEVQYH